MNSKIFYPILYALCFIAALIILVAYWVSSKFGDVPFEAILFHLQIPLTGSPFEYTISFLKRVLSSSLIAATGVLLAYFVLRKYTKKTILLKKIFLSLATSALLFSLYFIIDKSEIIPYLHNSSVESKFIEENYYKIPIDKIIFPEHKKNVIVLYLESMEDTFFNEELFFPPLIPKLKHIKDVNLSCVLQSEKHVGWTAGALTGLLFGLPLKLPIDGNKYSSVDNSFLPGAVSLLEVFEANGYSINFIAGSDTRFAGMRNIFISHASSPAIYDWPYFENDPETQARILRTKAEWGLDDKYLYGHAKHLLAKLASADAPFFVVIQTIDTHNEAKSFGDYPQPHGDARDAFIAADHMADEFISWISTQGFYKDTTILILGDHPYMNFFLGSVPLNGERNLYNVFLNASVTGAQNPADRRATMLDMAPSLLQAAGAQVPEARFGLGVSVFSDTPTLLERYGKEQLESLLAKRSFFYNNFFTLPMPVRRTHDRHF